MKIHVPIINKYSLCIFRQTNVIFTSRLMKVISSIDILVKTNKNNQCKNYNNLHVRD